MTNETQRYVVYASKHYSHIRDTQQQTDLHWAGLPAQAQEHARRMNATPEARYCCQCLQVIDRLYTRRERGKLYHYCSYCYITQFD